MAAHEFFSGEVSRVRNDLSSPPEVTQAMGAAVKVKTALDVAGLGKMGGGYAWAIGASAATRGIKSVGRRGDNCRFAGQLDRSGAGAKREFGNTVVVNIEECWELRRCNRPPGP